MKKKVITGTESYLRKYLIEFTREMTIILSVEFCEWVMVLIVRSRECVMIGPIKVPP